MTTGQPAPLDEAEVASTVGERETLEAFLDYHRRHIPERLTGLTEEQARRSLVPSATTLIGLVKHLAAVERAWFHRILAQRPAEEIKGNSRGDEPSWQVGPDETIADVIAEYEAACAESRQIAAGFALDDAVPHPRLGRVSLRWIYIHMIEETAQHAGHADILREQIDGATGLG
ncbi:MAG: DinB family protein [Micromonosporaceae bacterium]